MNGAIGSLIGSVPSVKNVELVQVFFALSSRLKGNGGDKLLVTRSIYVPVAAYWYGSAHFPRIPPHDLAPHSY
jgi:hypothetical protein